DSLPIVVAVFNMADFARYPLTIYNKTIRFVMTWIIPYGFTAFYPSAAFVSHSGFSTLALCTPLVAILSSWLAYAMWKVGLRSFASTGS
ncbi:MAG: ABC-2 family transporter protein, partial [Tumebacillaceae bacterium]